MPGSIEAVSPIGVADGNSADAAPRPIEGADDEMLSDALAPFIVTVVLNGLQECDRVLKRTDAYVKEAINDSN